MIDETITEQTVLTDHRTLVCTSDLINKNFQTLTTWVRSWKKVESAQMKDKVIFGSSMSITNKVLKNATSIDEVFLDLHETLKKVQNKFFPLKQAKIQPKRSKKKWVDNLVKRECLNKQKFHEEYLRLKTDWSGKRFKLQRNKTKNMIRQTQARYFEKA